MGAGLIVHVDRIHLANNEANGVLNNHAIDPLRAALTRNSPGAWRAVCLLSPSSVSPLPSPLPPSIHTLSPHPRPFQPLQFGIRVVFLLRPQLRFPLLSGLFVAPCSLFQTPLRIGGGCSLWATLTMFATERRLCSLGQGGFSTFHRQLKSLNDKRQERLVSPQRATECGDSGRLVAFCRSIED